MKKNLTKLFFIFKVCNVKRKLKETFGDQISRKYL